MIRINLLPIKQTEQAARRRLEWMRAALALALLVVIFLAVRINQGRRIGAAEARIVKLEGAVAVIENQVKDVSDLDQKKKALDAKLKVIADLGRKRVGPVGVLHDLSRAIPDRVWLTDVAEAGGSATLTGQATDNQILADFMRQLATSPYFTTVDLVESTQDLSGLRKFIIRATINYAAVSQESGEGKQPSGGHGKPQG